eukprot:2324418-Pyramimonas_sp.AAC.1
MNRLDNPSKSSTSNKSQIDTNINDDTKRGTTNYNRHATIDSVIVNMRPTTHTTDNAVDNTQSAPE